MLRTSNFAVLLNLILVGMISCHSEPDANSEQAVETTTLVKIGGIQKISMTEEVTLTATSAYLEKSVIQASVSGFIHSMDIRPGQRVATGKVLMQLITKEARSIGNAVNDLNPDFKFSGVSTIRAQRSGTIAEVNHQLGDYVTEGEQLAVIRPQNSFVFLLDVPYELHRIASRNTRISLELPDGGSLPGKIDGPLLSVDSVSQTERMIIRVNPTMPLPENLIAKVRLITSSHPFTQALPKSAVLSNETESEFWVMKLVNDSTAVKIPIKKGMQVGEQIEIIAPQFQPSDRIVTEGNFGLNDTARIRVR